MTLCNVRSALNVAALVNVIVAVSIGSGVAHEQADDSAENRQAQHDLTAVFKHANEMFKNGTSAEKVIKGFYAENIVIVGEGDAHATRTWETFLPQAIKLYQDGANPTCHYTITDPIIASATMATVFTHVACKALAAGKEATNVRVLYVFKKFGKDWKAVRQMWGVGEM